MQRAARWRRIRTWAAHAGRALLLLVATTAAVTAYGFWRRPELVARADAALVAAYVRPSEELAQRALRELATAPARGIALLEELLQSLVAVEKDERLSATKRTAFVALANALVSSGDLERALSVCERWIAHDDRDLDARLLQADILGKLPLRGEEGLRVLGELFELLPEDQGIARRRIERQLARRDPEGAARTFLGHVRAAGRSGGLLPPDPQEPWRLTWSSGVDLRAEGASTVVPTLADDVLRLELTLPNGARTLVLRPPAHAWLELARPEVLVRIGTAVQKVSLATLAPLARDLELTQEVLRCSGRASPEVLWELPGAAWDGAGVTLVLTGTFRGPDLGWTRPVMALAETGRLCAELSRPSATNGAGDVLDELAAQRLAAVRRALLSGATVEIGPGADTEAVALPLRARAGGAALDFAGQVVTRRRAAGLRVSLPPVVGARFRLEPLELESSGRHERLPVAPRGLVDARADGDQVVVTGPRPTLELPLGTGAPEARVGVRGEVR